MLEETIGYEGIDIVAPDSAGHVLCADGKHDGAALLEDFTSDQCIFHNDASRDLSGEHAKCLVVCREEERAMLNEM